MRKLVYSIASSLDGFLARKDGSFDCFLMQGPHVDDFVESLADYDAAIMGRKTYEAGLQWKVTNPFPNMDTWVFSKSNYQSLDENVSVSEDLVRKVKELKAQEGKGIFFSGASSLAQTLFDAGLIDEVHIKLNPVLIGSGLSLAGNLGKDVNLELSSSKEYSNGVVLLKYQVVFS